MTWLRADDPGGRVSSVIVQSIERGTTSGVYRSFLESVVAPNADRQTKEPCECTTRLFLYVTARLQSCRVYTTARHAAPLPPEGPPYWSRAGRIRVLKASASSAAALASSVAEYTSVFGHVR